MIGRLKTADNTSANHFEAMMSCRKHFAGRIQFLVELGTILFFI